MMRYDTIRSAAALFTGFLSVACRIYYRSNLPSAQLDCFVIVAAGTLDPEGWRY